MDYIQHIFVPSFITFLNVPLTGSVLLSTYMYRLSFSFSLLAVGLPYTQNHNTCPWGHCNIFSDWYRFP